MNLKRVREIKPGTAKAGAVIYWMSRDQRVYDNWSLIYAQETALSQKRPLLVIFSLVPSFINASLRQYSFMLRGLIEVERELKDYNIPFYLLQGDPGHTIPAFIKAQNAAILITDFDPLKIKRKWKDEVASQIDIPFFEVDAHNIVPCWVASSKQEFGAYTIRPKIQRLLNEFLEEFPVVKKMEQDIPPSERNINWHEVASRLDADRSVKEVDWILPGEREALRRFNIFLETKIATYSVTKNDPLKHGQSNLSPYLHFGQISAQRVALNAGHSISDLASTEAFLEELIIRRELSDNFCNYNQDYDSFNGFPDWARETLNRHRDDKREYIYKTDEFEQAATHDELWNAAQKEMTTTGKMFGYMRMYWAKKILEWSRSPEEAIKTAIYLNDKYELDGRDPNGYTGIAWSIGGVHDRAWGERDVFGKIRYMNYEGCKRKFDVKAYIRAHL